jgi:hypothetical protein
LRLPFAELQVLGRKRQEFQLFHGCCAGRALFEDTELDGFNAFAAIYFNAVTKPSALTHAAIAPKVVAMVADRSLVTFHGDESFRRGACHAGEWLQQTSRTLSEQGRSAVEISQHLSQLVGVLCDWRENKGPLPDGNPWDWSLKDLASVIKAREQR